MARVVVVGAGVGGLAAAARLAKGGHSVVLVERDPVALGGAVRRVEAAGYAWDAGPTSISLPAVVRDLFRKSGRPIERYLDLRLREVARRHVFDDGAVVDLPTGSRADQRRAIDAGLGAGAGEAWTAYLDSLAPRWDSLRRLVLDDPRGGARLADQAVASALGGRGSLARELKRGLRDERLRLMAGWSFDLAGSALRDVPAYAAVEPYVERSFGVWDAPDGMAAVTDALRQRMAERSVDVRMGTSVVGLLWDAAAGRVTGLETDDGQTLAADVVVADVDPRVVLGRWLDPRAAPAARKAFARAMPALPPTVAHLGIAGPAPALPDEVVFHGDPLLVLRTGGRAPAGCQAWTVLRRGAAGEDVVTALARRGVDVRDSVAVRVDRTPSDIVDEVGGSPLGIAADGYRAIARRAAQTSPVAGLELVGASVHPGAGMAYAAWGAAHAAARIGPA